MLLIKKNYNKSRGKNTYEESQRGRIEVFKEGNIQKQIDEGNQNLIEERIG